MKVRSITLLREHRRDGHRVRVHSPTELRIHRKELNMLGTYKRSALWTMLLGVLPRHRSAVYCAAILRWDCSQYLLRLTALGRQRIHLSMHGRPRSRGCLWQILIGIAKLIAALHLLVLPIAGVVTLTLVLAFFILVGAIIELAVFFRLRGLRGTVRFLVDGLVSLPLAGLIFLHWPTNSYRRIGWNQFAVQRHRKNHFVFESEDTRWL
jgi:hypothetical protein